MLLEHFADDVVVWAPAKVNLHLEILGKRQDGFHEVETLMAAVSLCDTLVFQDDASGKVDLNSNCKELSVGPDNLVMRAAALLRKTSGCQAGARICLVKRIPMAAGLAGGSSDAAATLVGLNELWHLGLSSEALAGLGAELGSDVAFFFRGPAAWCTGRGEIVRPAEVGRPLWLVLLCPPFGLATADVYRQVTVPASPRSGDDIRRALKAGDVEGVGRHLHNRLQDAAEKIRPEIADYQRQLEQLSPAGARMSGSGSALFALARDQSDSVRIAQELKPASEKGCFVLAVRSWS
jgi:4-diphosphocytidyl-2-C-methyl-D-erythritol kinase